MKLTATEKVCQGAALLLALLGFFTLVALASGCLYKGAKITEGVDLANKLVAKLEAAKQEEIKGYLMTAQTILDALNKYSWLCPQKWLNAYGLTLTAFADVVSAISDLKLTAEETAQICTAFQSVYAAWRAE